MKWIDIFKSGIEIGSENDIRNNQVIKSKDEINYSNSFNYPDSLIINGDNEKEIKNLYAAIDVETSEVLLVKELLNNGLEIDGILSHHPIGRGYYLIPEVIEIQKYNWIKFGVNKKIAAGLHSKLVWEESIEGRENHLGVENASKMLNIPLMCIHTPIDNIIQKFFEDLFLYKNNLSLKEALEIVNNIPECEKSSKNGDNPFIIGNGDDNEKLGKFFIDMTGGVDPPDEIFFHLKKAGVDTIIGMHYNIDNIKSMMKNKLPAIICGHMACDSIGLNLFCDFLEKQGVNIISGSGFYRYKRNG